MSLATKAQPITTNVSDLPDTLYHVTCCDDDIALCGQDVSDYPETDGDGELHCVVCEDLDDGDVPCCDTCVWID